MIGLLFCKVSTNNFGTYAKKKDPSSIQKFNPDKKKHSKLICINYHTGSINKWTDKFSCQIHLFIATEK